VDAERLEPEACDVCSRRMLPGERTRAYVTPESERRAVCDLCRNRAQRAGWIRADRARKQIVEDTPPKPKQRQRVRERLRRRAGPPRARPEHRIRRALDRFNESEHRRTVEGLTRSLGRPRVAAINPAEAPEVVRLTVAWELSWYQWKVELSGDDAAVSSLRSGKEVGELGAADRAWNARAGEDGRLRLGLSANGAREASAAAADE
jgi:hypothetical protein